MAETLSQLRRKLHQKDGVTRDDVSQFVTLLKNVIGEFTLANEIKTPLINKLTIIGGLSTPDLAFQAIQLALTEAGVEWIENKRRYELKPSRDKRMNV